MLKIKKKDANNNKNKKGLRLSVNFVNLKLEKTG
jgi:hypothetical protein